LIELAVVSGRPIAELRDLPDRDVATVLDVLIERSKR
jgi:hypothetical protein